jgi:bla regulator protein blaR1
MRRGPHFVCVAAWLAGFVLVAGGAPAQTQSSSAPLPTFDVVSIKPYGPNTLRISIHTKPDGVAVSGMPMHMILREAFGVTNDRLLGEPAWVTTSRYDVDAKVMPEDAPKFKQLTDQQQWQMLLPVLEDRCGLKFHHETRELTVYTLVVARGGLKMQVSKPLDPSVKLTPGQNPSSAGMSVSEKLFTLTGHRASMTSIVRWISMQLGSTVIDKTDLTESYDYTLSFVPDDTMKAGILPPGSNGGSALPPDAEGPSIFTALPEQLGLKLVAQKQPVDVIVIDHMEEPTAN